MYKSLLSAAILSSSLCTGFTQIHFKGNEGLGKGKKIVLLAGDEEYRSEEVMPMLAKILATHHGFNTTVAFSTNPQTGEIDPNEHHNIPGLEELADADLCIMFLRFRQPIDEQMKHFDAYVKAGKPIIGIRTSTHAFSYANLKVDGKETPNPSSFEKYSWRSKTWQGGFGEQVLGETWISHWGVHKKEGTRGIVEDGQAQHPILRGVKEVFGDTDVYEAHPPADATILMRGQVTQTMKDDSGPAVYSKKRANDNQEQDVNKPMMPIVWTREYIQENGKKNQVLTSTIGSGTDFKSEGLRRLIVNASFSLTGLDVPQEANVNYVGEYTGNMYGNNQFIKGLKPEDYAK